MRDYNLKKSDLLIVIEKLVKIDQVPEGYHYPELNRNTQLPIQLRDMAKRKKLHFMLKRL